MLAVLVLVLVLVLYLTHLWLVQKANCSATLKAEYFVTVLRTCNETTTTRRHRKQCDDRSCGGVKGHERPRICWFDNIMA